MVIIMFMYGCYRDKKYHETIDNGLQSSHVVIAQNCKYSRRSKSSVKINVDDKVYSVNLSSNVCERFPVHSTISVFYLKKYDEYIYKTNGYQDKFNFMLIILIASLFPWRFLYKRYIFSFQRKRIR